MAVQSTPKINRIIRMKEFDLLRTAVTPGNMYICIDSRKMYYDTPESRRVTYTCDLIETEKRRLYYVTPVVGHTYYIWETNSLWLWMNKWITLYSDKDYPSAYTYTDQTISPVYNGTPDDRVLDNNGLLGDGSIVIRDDERIIKGKIYVDQTNDNLVMSSFLGGGIKLLPNGMTSDVGELYADAFGKSHIRAEWNILNNEAYVDYSEHPEKDPSKFIKDSHRYLVYHEGNLDPTGANISSLMIYNKLKYPDSRLPDPFEFNVDKLDGKHASDFALAGHTHTTSNITDYTSKTNEIAKNVFDARMSAATAQGITISNPSTGVWNFAANNFKITLTGGISGSGTVNRLTNTTISVTVDPDKHKHKNLEDAIKDLQQQIDSIVDIDLTLYYTKTEIDDMFGLTAGKAPTIGTDNILHVTAEQAKKLDHTIAVKLTGEATGSGTLDTQQTTFEITNMKISTDVLDNYVLKSSIGVANGVTPLDANTKIPAKYLPDSVRSGLIPMGTFNPNNGVPSTDPKEGEFWRATVEGDLNGNHYEIGDWIVYVNGHWEWWQNSGFVTSVNGKTGDVTLTIPDVSVFINKSYIDYYNETTKTYTNVPKDKIVITDKLNHANITTSAADKLSKNFKLLSDATNGDVEFHSSSTNVTTDGTKDFNVKMKFTTTGIKAINDEIDDRYAFTELEEKSDLATLGKKKGTWIYQTSDSWIDTANPGKIKDGDLLLSTKANATNFEDFVIIHTAYLPMLSFSGKTAKIDFAVNSL